MSVYGEAPEYAMEFQEYGDSSDAVDSMLDALMDAESESDSYAERKRGGHGRGRGHRPAPPTAKGDTAYRAPTPQGYVTHNQLKEALGRVGEDVRRNAAGIKSVNEQVGRISDQVKDVVAVNTAQSARIGRLDRQIRLDGVLDFATSFELTTTNGVASISPNLAQLLRGALKSGMIAADSKAASSNPMVIGGLGFLLNNPQILGGILGARQ